MSVDIKDYLISYHEDDISSIKMIDDVDLTTNKKMNADNKNEKIQNSTRNVTPHLHPH